LQTTPLVAGLAVGAAAYAARTAIVAFQSFKAAGPRMKQFYKGGFLPEMNRREASQILGVRESAPDEKIKEAHRRIMIANHPDAGGSSFIAAKVNEAKDILMGKKKNGSSIF
jgi:DnaJ family protein C protein 19